MFGGFYMLFFVERTLKMLLKTYGQVNGLDRRHLMSCFPRIPNKGKNCELYKQSDSYTSKYKENKKKSIFLHVYLELLTLILCKNNRYG